MPVIALIALILMMRLIGLGWGLPDARHRWPYHPDESLALTALAQMKPGSFDFNPRTPAGHHLYVYFTGATLLVAQQLGIIRIERNPEHYREAPVELTRIYLLLRCTGIAWDLLGILGVFCIARLLAGNEAGWWAALIGAVDPFRVYIAHIATYYVPVMALTTIALYLMMREKKILGGIVTGLAMSFVYIGGIPLAFAAIHWRRRPRDLARILGAAAIAFLATSPYFLLDLQTTLGGFGRISGHYLKPSASIGLSWVSIEVLSRTLSPWFLLLALVGIAGAAIRIPRTREFLAYGGVAVGVLFLLRSPFARHYVFLYPLLEVAAGVFGAAVGFKYATRSLLVVVSLTLAFHSAALLASFQGSDPRDQARDWIETNIAPGTRFAGVNWYFAPHIDIAKYPTTMLWGDLPTRLAQTPHEYLILSDCDATLWTWDSDTAYARVATFRDELPGWAASVLHPDDPFDLRYSRPEIALYRRTVPWTPWPPPSDDPR